MQKHDGTPTVEIDRGDWLNGSDAGNEWDNYRTGKGPFERVNEGVSQF